MDMSEEKERLIIKNKPDLLRTIKLTSMFWATLSKYDVITPDDIAEIQKCGTASPHTQTDDLLNHVMCAVSIRYTGFLRALAETGQTHVITAILQEPVPETVQTPPPQLQPHYDTTCSAGDMAADILRNTRDVGDARVEHKSKYLKINVVNLDPQRYLHKEEEFFMYGRFWIKYPIDKVQPYMAVTFPVCNCDGNPMGVSGGVGFGIYDMHGNRAEPGMFVCAFSDLMFGSLKGKCALGRNVEGVWDKLHGSETIREERFGFHTNGGKTFTFIWKPKEMLW